jgi:uncharacterized glyoxalase superfamily protein PhnB
MIEIQTLFPVMVAENLTELKQFYTSVFGFEAVFFDPNFYLHLVSPNSGVQLGFLVPNHASQPVFLHPIMSTEGYVISFEVADATKSFTEAMSMKLPIAMELTHEEWGQVHFMLEDPAGFKIDIVEHQDTTSSK